MGDILQFYDSDKQIPVLGFGAALPPRTHIASHCFALNGNIFDPEVNGIDEVVDVYKHVLNKIRFYGPTHFQQIVSLACDYAESQ